MPQRNALAPNSQSNALAKLSTSEEQQFQNWIRSTEWYKEFAREFGEEPDLNIPDYDYRAAWKAGIQPERDPYDKNRFHWPSTTAQGQPLKSASHPTAWKEGFMQQTGMNPDAINLSSKQDADAYLSRLYGTAPQLRMDGRTGLAPYGARYASEPGEPFQAKGLGYMGKVPTAMGAPMTELSTTFEVNGRPMSAPLMVPTLLPQEMKALQAGGQPTEDVYRKAFEFAQSRRKQGRDPFAQPQDLRMTVPR
jgi:hypothetical protein